MAGVKRTTAGTWAVTWRDPANRSAKRTFKRKADADRFAAEVEGTKVLGKYLDPLAGQETFASCAERVPKIKRAQWRPTTYEQDRICLDVRILPTFGAMPLATITSDDLEAYLVDLSQDYAASTVEVTWAHVRLILRRAHQARLIAWDRRRA